ncbi:MAG: hypothetical protein MSL26_05885 [Clostridiales bacterium]|nr:hypothetical protein [Clostridiales bacterium]
MVHILTLVVDTLYCTASAPFFIEEKSRCETVRRIPDIPERFIKAIRPFSPWGSAPTPRQRAFRFPLPVSATGSGRGKPLWKPLGSKPWFFLKYLNFCPTVPFAALSR